jgi:hypothetical protein
MNISYDVRWVCRRLRACSLVAAGGLLGCGASDERRGRPVDPLEAGVEAGQVAESHEGGSQETAVATIGAEGGTVSGAGVDLVVPAGALLADTSLSIRLATEDYPPLPDGASARSSVFALEPHGLSFAKPVSIRLPFAGEAVASLSLITANPGGPWETVEGATFDGGYARAALMHFSFLVVKDVVASRHVSCVPRWTQSPGSTYYVHTYASDGTLSTIDTMLGPGTGTVLNQLRITATRIEELDYYARPSCCLVRFQDFLGGGPLNGFPTHSSLGFTDPVDGITHTNIMGYSYEYDGKGRLAILHQATGDVVGDPEFDEKFSYDDHDNVVAMSHVMVTGPAGVYTTTATYDDKPSPYSSIRHWYNVRPRWGAGDPESTLTGLSQHNVLSLTMYNGDRTTFEYTYNNHGYPVKRVRTSTSASGAGGTYSEETYEYDCP